MYDPSLSYEENYAHGPFQKWCYPKQVFPFRRFLGLPRFDFFGQPVYLPFGIPAGPLLNGSFVQAAWNAGVSICTYKTVRSTAFPCHPYPNVLSLRAKSGEVQFASVIEENMRAVPQVLASNLTPSYFKGKSAEFARSVAISNSFGVPSQAPNVWQNDVKNTLQQGECALKGRALVVSFQGTRQAEDPDHKLNSSDCFEDFLKDTLHCQRLALLSAQHGEGVPVLEVNLSCPNEAGLPIYTNIEQSLFLLRRLKAEREDDARLIVKIGSLGQSQCDEFVQEAAPYIDGISAINTVLAEITTSDGSVALGSGQLRGGVCGDLIFQENMRMLDRLVRSRSQLKTCSSGATSLHLISVGGVTTAQRFSEAMARGADSVQAATACMWNLDLAADIAHMLGVPFAYENDKGKECE